MNTNVECRFVVHCEGTPDMHFAKLVVTKDGKRIPKLVHIENFKRDFWVVARRNRSFEEYVDYIEIDKCLRYKSTQTRLKETLSKILGKRFYSLRDACSSPYVFGADIKSTAIIKHNYQQKSIASTPYSVAVFDIETITNGEDRIACIATITYENKIFTAVLESVVETKKLEEKIKECMELNIPDVTKNREFELVICKEEIDLFRNVFKKAHEWKPDFVAIWNMDYDISVMLEACSRAGIKPETFACDPSIPEKYKVFDYIRGKAQKVTTSGKITTIKPAAQWHTVIVPASFYIIDAMCVYKHVRKGSQDESSYALDYILKKHKIGGKLKFDDSPNLTGLDWHKYMLTNRTVEYIVYNIYDCLSVEILDQETKDMSVTLPTFAGCSDFFDFKSEPRKKCDELHWFFLENDCVIGCTASDLVKDMDKNVLTREDWIITLPNFLVHPNPFNHLKTNTGNNSIFSHVGDLDVSASYPNGEVVYNISRRTTARELVTIKGMSEKKFRDQNLNLTGGQVNAVEYCINMFSLPNHDEILKLYKESKNGKQ